MPVARSRKLELQDKEEELGVESAELPERMVYALIVSTQTHTATQRMHNISPCSVSDIRASFASRLRQP
jgi:hypothetical protein